MLKTFPLICMLLVLAAATPDKTFHPNRDNEADVADETSITILPANPIIEKDDNGQYLNFDIIIKNNGTRTLELSAVDAEVLDASTKMVVKRSLNSNGKVPGIKIIGNNIIKPGKTICIFNPLNTFAPDVKFTYLQYEFYFNYFDPKDPGAGTKHRLPMDFDLSVQKVIVPKVYEPKTNLALPLKGRLAVWDGHDFSSHHRRFPLGLDNILAKDITANSNRYAYDFVNVDEKGEMYQGDPFKKESWYAFGKPVYAPADGIVVAMVNDIPDNQYSGKSVKSPANAKSIDPLGMGNYIIMDHGNGEFSALLHMEEGSIKLQAGTPIKAGQKIGVVGFSGDAIFPHLHYNVMNGSTEQVSEGLPSNFSNYKIYRGNNMVTVKRGRIDTGDIVEAEK